MKVKDFAAELIGEIADECGYLVYKYECSSPSCGSVVFEITLEAPEDAEPVRRYKMLNYAGYEVTLVGPMASDTIDLHKAESVDFIRDFFKDEETWFETPFAFGYNSNFGFTHTTISGNYTTMPTSTITTGPYITNITSNNQITYNPIHVGGGARSSLGPIRHNSHTFSSNVATPTNFQNIIMNYINNIPNGPLSDF